MTITTSIALVAAHLGTTLAQVVAAPAAGAQAKPSLCVCNYGAASATFDLSLYDGTNDFYIAKTVTCDIGKPVPIPDYFLVPGYSLRARASAASTLDITGNVVTQVTT